jgi:ASTRA-associated protein 1
MSTSLPVDGTASVRRQPWLLHILEVNTLNFCSFSHCKVQGKLKNTEVDSVIESGAVEELLIAIPNTITSEAVS